MRARRTQGCLLSPLGHELLDSGKQQKNKEIQMSIKTVFASDVSGSKLITMPENPRISFPACKSQICQGLCTKATDETT